MSSVEGTARQAHERTAVLDLLVDNDGVMAKRSLATGDGFEMPWATHHLGASR